MLGQDFCECVKVCDLVKSKLALLLDAWGVKESELLTWEGCGKVTPCAFLNLSLGFNVEEFVRYLSRKKDSWVNAAFYIFVSIGYGVPSS